MTKEDATSTTLRVFEPPTTEDVDVYAVARACLDNIVDELRQVREENARLKELVEFHAPWELEDSK